MFFIQFRFLNAVQFYFKLEKHATIATLLLQYEILRKQKYQLSFAT